MCRGILLNTFICICFFAFAFAFATNICNGLQRIPVYSYLQHALTRLLMRIFSPFYHHQQRKCWMLNLWDLTDVMKFWEEVLCRLRGRLIDLKYGCSHSYLSKNLHGFRDRLCCISHHCLHSKSTNLLWQISPENWCWWMQLQYVLTFCQIL